MAVPQLRVEPWSRPEPPSREAIEKAFRDEGLSAHAWSNGPGYRYGAHSHAYHKVLYCVSGGITFHVDGTPVELSPGDRLELPPGRSHSADVGPRGVTCMEAAVY